MGRRFLVGRRSETDPVYPYSRNWISASWTRHDGAGVRCGRDCTWSVSLEAYRQVLNQIGYAHAQTLVERVCVEVFGGSKGQTLRKMNRGEVSCQDW